MITEKVTSNDTSSHKQCAIVCRAVCDVWMGYLLIPANSVCHRYANVDKYAT